MAVLKKIRSRWWSLLVQSTEYPQTRETAATPTSGDARYDTRSLSISQLDECWRLDQRCFVDGEAYSRDTLNTC